MPEKTYDGIRRDPSSSIKDLKSHHVALDADDLRQREVAIYRLQYGKTEPTLLTQPFGGLRRY